MKRLLTNVAFALGMIAAGIASAQNRSSGKSA